MQKVIVIGSPGAGKSTFARQLRAVTNLPLYYLDMLWHKPNRTTVDRTIFDEKLKEIVLKDKWIIDGNYGSTLDERLPFSDEVIWLKTPRLKTMFRVIKRSIKSRVFGKNRPDIAGPE